MQACGEGSQEGSPSVGGAGVGVDHDDVVVCNSLCSVNIRKLEIIALEMDHSLTIRHH